MAVPTPASVPTTANFVTRATQLRLLKDVKEVMKYPLTEHGIFYSHDEANIMQGFAIIMGPKDTIYAFGIYCFIFTFPHDYPFTPPSLTFKTHDGITRFHPNLYRNGKVCLSILNTWRGEQWTSCQSIRTILLTLVALFTNNPLLNEPGIGPSHKSVIPYNKIIQYRNLEAAVLGMLVQHNLPPQFIVLFPFIRRHFLSNRKKILNLLTKLANKEDGRSLYEVSLYGMKCKPCYKQLMGRMEAGMLYLKGLP